jgi:F0F1-type ATP synthase assembly protein I
VSSQDVRSDDRSLGELFSQLTADMGTLVRKELELAKVEGREELKQAASSAAMSLEAAMGAFMAVLFASLALAWLLDQAMNTALAFLIVAVVWGIVAAVLLSSAKKRAQRIRMLPETKQTLKEDEQWARTQTN